MSIIWTIIIGFIAGTLAKFIVPGKDPGGIIVTILIGIAGSILFTYLGNFFGIYQEDEAAGFIGATIGAIILLTLYRLFKKKST
jgi:uncharacterized membrane protein YeaQ/YmgE (transglycosylase-associated protein family)